MNMAKADGAGLALGAWGSVQALAAGMAIASGGLLSDAMTSAARAGRLGPTLAGPATGYTTVYLIELGLLFLTLIAIGPLARRSGEARSPAAPALNPFSQQPVSLQEASHV
jgi:BCD family chlorophyll transporter-like MFS transporter